MPDPSSEAALPPQQDAVRRLLADARHTGPPPPEVVARLDEALASLVAERGTSALPADPPAPVVDLGARRRRLAGIGLLAAAAVVVAGVGLGQVLPRSGGDAGSADSSTAGSDRSTSLDRVPEDSAEDSGGGAAETGPQSLKSTATAPQTSVPSLTSDDPDLAETVQGLRSQATRVRLGSSDAGTPCSAAVPEGARRLAVDVDGRPGVLVFRRSDGEAQQVELYTCDAPGPVRTLTIPAP